MDVSCVNIPQVYASAAPEKRGLFVAAFMKQVTRGRLAFLQSMQLAVAAKVWKPGFVTILQQMQSPSLKAIMWLNDLACRRGGWVSNREAAIVQRSFDRLVHGTCDTLRGIWKTPSDPILYDLREHAV